MKEKEVEKKTYWKCDGYKKMCKGRVICNANGELIIKNHHNHEGKPALLQVNQMITEIKTQAQMNRQKL